jgi:hypothetical protein
LLRDFWFQILLALVGVVISLAGLNMVANGRKALFSLGAFVFFLAVLSFIWGDPVRGPFSGLLRPSSKSEFEFHAGATCVFPIKQLSEGIEFGQCIDIPGNPVRLRIQKTWWSGTKISARILDRQGQVVLEFDGNQIKQISEPADVNYDDFALEMVNNNRKPILQVVISEDIEKIYVNALLFTSEMAIVIKDDLLASLTREQAKSPFFNFKRIFKYPSYANLHRRE